MINFLKYRRWYFLFSITIIVVGWYYVLTRGFVYSIDFVGGGLIEFTGRNINANKLAQLEKRYSELSFQRSSSGFTIRGTKLNQTLAKEVRQRVTQELPVKAARYEVVGPTISTSNIEKIAYAVIIAILGILVYVALNFHDWRFGIAALVALVHDTLALIGVWGILSAWWGFELDVLFVTAILTTMSFSVHDTIVIFDKIQEEAQAGNFADLATRINWSLNLTMMRSLNNSLTVVIMLSSLLILGGESTRAFAASLLIGTLFGTYSSPFVATPLYYQLAKSRQP